MTTPEWQHCDQIMLELRLGIVARSAGRDLGNAIAMCDRHEFARDHVVGSLRYPFDAAIDADLPLEFLAHTRRSNAFSADHIVSSPMCFVTRRRTGDYRDKASTRGALSGHPNQATARGANERMAASREAQKRLERQLSGGLAPKAERPSWSAQPSAESGVARSPAPQSRMPAHAAGRPPA